MYGSHVLLLCDNPFAEYIKRGLANAGASVNHMAELPLALDDKDVDAILVALRPRKGPVLSVSDAKRIAERCAGAVVAQFWGDIDRETFAACKVAVWPAQSPAAGHMGVLPSAVGPEPVIRLQTGGLKVGELLWRARRAGMTPEAAIASAVEAGFADQIEAWMLPLG